MNASVDFFNAIVTLSSVVLFAKFVTHRTRRQSLTTRLRRLHVTCVMSSIGALTFAFVSLELERDPPPWLHVSAAVLMSASVLILVFDALCDDRKQLTHADAVNDPNVAQSVESPSTASGEQKGCTVRAGS